MNTLMVGGNRFVGVEIVWQLLRAGHDVMILSLDAPPEELRPHVHWAHVNRNDDAALRAVLGQGKYDAVIDNIAYEPGQIHRLADALEGRIGRYLLTSTADSYLRNHPRTWREDEADIRSFDLNGLDEATRYSRGKRSCEAALSTTGLAWTVVRPCVVTGVRDNVRGAPIPRWTLWFEEAARSHFWPARVNDGGPIVLASEDEFVWQMVWVTDLARAISHLLGHDDAIGQAYNVAGDEIWTNERLIRALAHAAGVSPEIVHVPEALIEQAGVDYHPVYGTGAAWSLCDNSKLKTTGWRPTPAEQWLPLLLEAQGDSVMRMRYHTRLQEIALARRVQWRSAQRPNLATVRQGLPAIDGATDSSDPVANRLPGRLEPSASAVWRNNVVGQYGVAAPRLDFYRTFEGAVVSGIGVGTWMGEPDDVTDRLYEEALIHAACRGLNVFDTAINYRRMRAERCVGRAIRRLARVGITREALLIATKGGYISQCFDDHREWDDFVRDEYLAPGLIDAGDATRNHSISSQFIERQIELSLNNLCLETIDIYFLHNPEEALSALGPAVFAQRMAETLIVLEGAVAAGKISCYGLATWDGLRVMPGDSRHLSLDWILEAATEAAARHHHDRHHLRVLQFPFNVHDRQAMTVPNQMVDGRLLPVLEAAIAHGLYCFTSATALQGVDVAPATEYALRKTVAGCTLRTAAVHVARSTRGVGTALVGMRRVGSVEQAIAVASMERCDFVWG